MGGGAPPGVTSAQRLNELLDQIRAEFETQLRQSENYEHQSEQPLSALSRDSCRLAPVHQLERF